MDNIDKNKLSINLPKTDSVSEKPQTGEFKDKKVTSPRNIEKKNLSKENALLKSESTTDITKREVLTEEEIEAQELFAKLFPFAMSDNLSEEEQKAAEDALIKYASNDPDCLEKTDFEGNNLFHWAVTINSDKAWNFLRDRLDEANKNKNITSDPLIERNVSGIGDTPWELVLQSTDLEFVNNVLEDELKRNPDSPFLTDLLKEPIGEINKYAKLDLKEGKNIIAKYIEYRGLLAGDEKEIDNVITNSYQTWKKENIKNGQQDSMQIEDFMRTPVYLAIATTVLSKGNQEGTGYLNKISNQCPLKVLLQDPSADQAGVKSCLLAIFEQKDCPRIFKQLGYEQPEVIKLVEKYIFEIAGSNAFKNVMSVLINKYRYNKKYIATLLSMRDQNGNTPLHLAGSKGDLASCIDALDKIGFSHKSMTNLLSRRDKNYYSPLDRVAWKGDLASCIDALDKIGFSHEAMAELLSEPFNNSISSLHSAAKEGHLASCIKMLDKIGFTNEEIKKSLSMTVAFDQTPLHHAADKGHLASCIDALNDIKFSNEAITKLLSMPDERNDAPLPLAAKEGHLDSCIDALNDIKFTNEEITKLLSMPNGFGNSTLCVAAEKGDLASCIKMLDKIGFTNEEIKKSLSMPARNGNLPLHSAGSKGDLASCIKTLDEIGFTNEEITKLLSMRAYGMVPLHLAGWKGDLASCIKTLDEIGFTNEAITKLLSTQDKEDITGYLNYLLLEKSARDDPLHTAAKVGHLASCVKTLKDIGFSKEAITQLLSIMNQDGKTPLFDKENDKELTQTLLKYAGLNESDIKPLYLRQKYYTLSNFITRINPFKNL